MTTLLRLSARMLAGTLLALSLAPLAILLLSPPASASICNDGTYSQSTGQGTCSWHGGVGRELSGSSLPDDYFEEGCPSTGWYYDVEGEKHYCDDEEDSNVDGKIIGGLGLLGMGALAYGAYRGL